MDANTSAIEIVKGYVKDADDRQRCYVTQLMQRITERSVVLCESVSESPCQQHHDVFCM